MCTPLGNHKAILEETGHTDVRQYRYYDKKTKGLDYQGMLEDLKVRITVLAFCLATYTTTPADQNECLIL